MELLERTSFLRALTEYAGEARQGDGRRSRSPCATWWAPGWPGPPRPPAKRCRWQRSSAPGSTGRYWPGCSPDRPAVQDPAGGRGPVRRARLPAAHRDQRPGRLPAASGRQAVRAAGCPADDVNPGHEANRTRPAAGGLSQRRAGRCIRRATRSGTRCHAGVESRTEVVTSQFSYSSRSQPSRRVISR